jgi:hypothetical protein
MDSLLAFRLVRLFVGDGRQRTVWPARQRLATMFAECAVVVGNHFLTEPIHFSLALRPSRRMINPLIGIVMYLREL